MALFYRFLLAHLISDFPLQTTELVRWKQRSAYGVAVHCLIGGATALLLVWPDRAAFWPGILALTIVHFLTDQGKIWLTNRHPGSDNVYSFVGDQVVHVLFLGVIAALYRKVPLTSFGGGLGLIPANMYVLDPPHIVYPICIIASAFAGTYLVLSLAKTYTAGNADLTVSYPQELLGIVERGTITACVAIGTGPAWLAAGAAITLKALAGLKLHNDPDRRRDFMTFDVVFSACFAIALGLIAQAYAS